jgi:hypothetical protein
MLSTIAKIISKQKFISRFNMLDFFLVFSGFLIEYSALTYTLFFSKTNIEKEVSRSLTPPMNVHIL